MMSRQNNISAQEEAIWRNAFILQRQVIFGDEYLIYRGDYTPLKCQIYEAIKFIQKIYRTPYSLSELYIASAERIKNLDMYLNLRSYKSFKINKIKTLWVDNDDAVTMTNKLWNGLWSIASKVTDFIRISNWQITMKQLSKILIAFIHCKTIVLYEIEIIDPKSTLKIMPKLCHKSHYLYILSDWDAQIVEKLFQSLSQNESFKNNCQIDIPRSNKDWGIIMKLARDYWINMI